MAPPRILLLLALSSTLLISILPILVDSHPQCLDFRPPFRPTGPLRFCRHLQNSSCCDARVDNNMFLDYRRMLFSHPNRTEAGQCVGLLFHLSCAPCNPYAAHIYDAEDDGVQSPFPGLCPDFCRLFFRLCRAFVPKLTESPNLQRLAADPSQTEGFCREVSVKDTIYCYPQILNNQALQNEIVDTFSSNQDCICLQEVAQDLQTPLILETIPDNSGRMVVGEHAGIVYIYSREWVRNSTPFLDVSDIVVVNVGTADERGFLGLAFHPQYARNGKIYCYFTTRNTLRPRQFSTDLVEFTVNATDPNRVNRTSERLLLKLQQPYTNHNGGSLFFGIDGYLYLFTGDGGAGGDPGNRAQDRSNLFGKALRFDVDSPTRPYSIPRDNPFQNTPNVRPEIYAYGLRNPWRCSVDQGDHLTGAGRGRIFCGDVGQNSFEEIDIIENGKDYGWRRREGFECFNPRNCGAPRVDEVLPIFAYNRSVGRSVTGGYVYRGCENPDLNGAYIMGDFETGRLIKLEEDRSARTGWKDTQLNTCGPELCFNGLTNNYERRILSFGTDGNGEIYILSTGRLSTRRGTVYKIVDPRRRGDPTTCRSNNNVQRGK